MTTTSKILSGIIVVLVLACGFFFFTHQPVKLGQVYGVSAFNDYVDSTSATTTLATYPGILHTILVNTPIANSVIKIIDANSTTTAASGTVIATITVPSTAANPFELTFDNIMTKGLTVVQSGATSTLTAEFQQN
jgi:hypothetical protein